MSNLWVTLDNNSASKAIAAGDNSLYQLHDSGKIWRFNGTPLTGWDLLDNNPATRAIVTSGNQLYQLHDSGKIWKFNGTPLTGWDLLDNNPATKSIVAAGKQLYQLHADGKIWRFNGTPLTGWDLLDQNADSMAIVAAYTPPHVGHQTPPGGFGDPSTPEKDHLYQIHKSGKIWRYVGPPLTGWELLDANPASSSIAASGEGLFQAHADGTVWSYIGPPMTGWASLGEFPGLVSLVAGGGVEISGIASHIASGIFVLQSNGTIKQYIEVIT